jgi:hypothetical protein
MDCRGTLELGVLRAEKRDDKNISLKYSFVGGSVLVTTSRVAQRASKPPTPPVPAMRVMDWSVNLLTHLQIFLRLRIRETLSPLPHTYSCHGS